jgi:hypothetical protein
LGAIARVTPGGHRFFWMKTFLMLLLGVSVGTIGTLMYFTIDIPYDSPGRDGPGGGNARLSLDEDALASIIGDQISQFEAFGADTAVGVRVHTNGLIDVNIGIGVSPVGTTILLVLDPEVVDGRLEIVVAQAQVGGLIAPREIARVIEEQLRRQLDALAAGFDYRITAIITTDRRLTFEIQI